MAKEVSAGAYHTCAVKEGELACWGSDGHGQTQLSQEISSPMDVQMVSAGANHTCALDRGQVLICWGIEVRIQIPTEYLNNIA